ncbi:MAG TPA: hypothetical protein V6D06_20975 [Trichocoleus sp.]
MTHPPPDQQLIDFLQRYRPLPPAAHSDLEDRLMSALPDTATAAYLPWFQQHYRRLAVSALLVTGLLALTAVRTWRQPQLSQAEREDLELFVTETWTRTYSDFPLNEPTPSEISSADTGWLLPLPTDTAAD